MLWLLNWVSGFHLLPPTTDLLSRDLPHRSHRQGHCYDCNISSPNSSGHPKGKYCIHFHPPVNQVWLATNRWNLSYSVFLSFPTSHRKQQKRIHLNYYLVLLPCGRLLYIHQQTLKYSIRAQLVAVQLFLRFEHLSKNLKSLSTFLCLLLPVWPV